MKLQGAARVEAHTRFYEMNPVGRFTYRGIDYCVGSGGPYFDWKDEFPKGYYQTAYYIMSEDKMVICGDQQYEIGHDQTALLTARETMRINACHKLAREFIDLGLENGALPILIEMTHAKSRRH